MCMKYILNILTEIATWCHGGLITIHYGLLYNWYAATDVRNMANIGWHIPTDEDWYSLALYLDPLAVEHDLTGSESMVAGGILKETGLIYWNTPNTGAVNSVGFNSRGCGIRYLNGLFAGIKTDGTFWCTEGSIGTPSSAYYHYTVYNSARMGRYLSYKYYGYSIRPLKDSTTLTNGQAGTYTGNDGKIYRTICIGSQEWVADNLAETEYRNGDTIPEVTDNAAWAALTTGALCAYNNDWTNV